MMSAAGRCVFGHLLRCSLIRRQCGPVFLRPGTGTSVSRAASQLGTESRRSPDRSNDDQSPDRSNDDQSLSRPIKFSTSKGSYRTWKVERSLGARFQRPWWQVLPLSLVTVGFLLWCILRKESDIDRALEKHLFEHLPGLMSNIEQTKNMEGLQKEPDDVSKQN